MTRTIRSDTSPAWAELFTGFRESAFRLETLQHYTTSGETEGFDRFLRGEDPQVDLSYWLELVRRHVAAGRRMGRVRVAREPLSDYTRFELAHFPLMAEAGDDIRILPTAQSTWPEGVPEHDFWLFDEREVWILHYDDVGALIEAELVTDPQEVADHLHWRDVAMAQAVPVVDYLAAAGARQAS